MRELPHVRVRAAARRSCLTPEARGRELKELPHAQSQGYGPEARATPYPRSGGCMGAGGLGGATPPPRLGREQQ